jgi:hypothetical protein
MINEPCGTYTNQKETPRMALETEIKLSLPANAARRLPAHRLLADSKPIRQKLINTYYDTPDQALQRKRLAVRYRQKGAVWLLTVKSDAPSPGGLAQRSEWEAPGQPGEFDFSHVDNPKLRRFLEAATPELVPVFTTDFTRSFWLLTPQEGTRIEVALDRGKIVAGGTSGDHLRSRTRTARRETSPTCSARQSPCRPICHCIPKAPARPSAAIGWPARQHWRR